VSPRPARRKPRRIVAPDGTEMPEILYPRGLARVYRNPRVARFVARQFDRVYYGNLERTIFDTRWLGAPATKYPADLWTYQEIIAERRPGLIVETGTLHGGSALFLASICDLIDHGRVISIDLHERPGLPVHDRVEFVVGSSTDPEIVDNVRREAEAAEGVLVILDSDHSRDHVLAELRAYAGMVGPGDYLVVEDTNVDGNPVLPDFGPGPTKAIEIFLGEHPEFEIDASREKFLHSANPGGYLRRTRAGRVGT
jgi:cephalosporin hydroxylase